MYRIDSLSFDVLLVGRSFPGRTRGTTLILLFTIKTIIIESRISLLPFLPTAPVSKYRVSVNSLQPKRFQSQINLVQSFPCTRCRLFLLLVLPGSRRVLRSSCSGGYGGIGLASEGIGGSGRFGLLLLLLFRRL